MYLIELDMYVIVTFCCPKMIFYYAICFFYITRYRATLFLLAFYITNYVCPLICLCPIDKHFIYFSPFLEKCCREHSHKCHI